MNQAMTRHLLELLGLTACIVLAGECKEERGEKRERRERKNCEKM
jgi:hypothetical protein